MGLKKYNILELFDKSPLVTASSISKRVPNSYYKQLIKNLLDKKKIFRVTKGKYSRFYDPSLFVFAVSPSYLGLQDAMAVHDIWPQETTPIIITGKRIRAGLRKILDSNVMVRRIDRKYLFGIEFLDFKEYYLPYSDVEKTYIDMIYFDETMDKEVSKQFKAKIKRGKLKRYLTRYPKRFQERCLKKLYKGDCQN